jgi:WD40 repeat protein
MRCVKTFSGHENKVLSVACSPDALYIASGSRRKVKIFNMQTGDVFRTISTDDWVRTVQFLDQDRLMYATRDPTFVIQDLTKTTNTPTPASKNWLTRYFREAQVKFELLHSRYRHTKTNPTRDVNVLMFKYQGFGTAISSDGTRIASQAGNVVKIWQTDGPSPNHDMVGHQEYVHSVAFSEDGRLVASGSTDRTAKIWDPTTGRCLHTFNHPDWVTSVIFSPDSTLLACASFSQTIHIWDTRTHNLISSFETLSRGIRYYHFSLGLSPNGDRLVSLREPLHPGEKISVRLELWEIATGKCLTSMELDRCFDKVTFGVDGTSVILEDNGETMRWSISPNRSTPDGDKDGHWSLPITFVPLHDTRQSAPPCLHHYQPLNEWILDEQERRVLWVPPDLRNTSDSYGKKVVLGSVSGRVPIVDVSDVQF